MCLSKECRLYGDCSAYLIPNSNPKFSRYFLNFRLNMLNTFPTNVNSLLASAASFYSTDIILKTRFQSKIKKTTTKICFGFIFAFCSFSAQQFDQLVLNLVFLLPITMCQTMRLAYTAELWIFKMWTHSWRHTAV